MVEPPEAAEVIVEVPEAAEVTVDPEAEVAEDNISVTPGTHGAVVSVLKTFESSVNRILYNSIQVAHQRYSYLLCRHTFHLSFQIC